MMARATIEPLDVAGAFTSPRDCKHFRYARKIDQFLAFGEESIYEGLGRTFQPTSYTSRKDEHDLSECACKGEHPLRVFQRGEAS